MSDRRDLDLEELLKPLDLPPPRRTPGWVIAVAAAAIVLVGGGWWLAGRDAGAPTASAPTETTAGEAPTTAAGSDPSEPASTTTTTEPGPPDLTVDPPPSSEIEVPIPDGPTLAGRLFEGGPVGILLVHPFETGAGGPTSVEEISPIGAALARAGYTVLLADLRGHGASPGERDHTPLEDDVAAMYASLVDTGVEETFVVAWGVSGTAAVADTATGRIDPAGLVGLFVRPQYLGLDVITVLPEATTPMRFVSVEAGRSTRWAIRMLAAAPEGLATRVELPPSGGDPIRDLWPFVVEEIVDFVEATRGAT